MAQHMRKKPKRGPNEPGKVGETMVAYEVVQPQVNVIENGVTRMSSKNQITLPVAMVRMLGLQPGDEIGLLAMDGAIYLERQLHGRALHEQLRGSMKHVPEWNTKEAIDAYIRDSREDDAGPGRHEHLRDSTKLAPGLNTREAIEEYMQELRGDDGDD